MNPKYPAIHNDQHLANLDACLHDAQQCQQLLADLREAGVPAEVAEQRVAENMRVATGLKRIFFPGST